MSIFAPGRLVRGGVLTLALGAVALGAMTWLGTRMWIATSVSTEVTTRELHAALLGGGLSPTKLAASSVGSEATTTLVGNARAYLNNNPGQLATAQAVVAAQANVERLEMLVQQGKGTGPDITALATARSTLATATSNRSAELAAFIEAAEEGLNETQRARLATIRANAGLNLHVKYLVTTRSSAEWVALRDALTSCAVRAHNGEAADPACASLVSDANAVSATSTADQALTSNLASVTTAFNTAVGL